MLVVGGWVAAHAFNVRRDTVARRRDLRVQYLLDAYRRLESLANRSPTVVEEGKRAFESAVADVQLLGTRDQIDALLDYLRVHARMGGSDIHPVLELLRMDLSRELNLESGVQKMEVFRFKSERDGGGKTVKR